MNYLHHLLNFSTTEEGEKNWQKAVEIRDSMGCALYYSILTEDVLEIQWKLDELRRKLKHSNFDKK